MDYLYHLFMGALQGLTEFLPVSSSGHLAFASSWIQLQNDWGLALAVHGGTLLSILTVYKRSLIHITLNLSKNVNTIIAVIFGTIPAGIVGILFHEHISHLFSQMFFVGFSFWFTGMILFWADKKYPGSQKAVNMTEFKQLPPISKTKALIVGVWQSIALIPGVSRSGSTIAAGLFVGLDRKTATIFSFLLAIPAILGALVLHVTSGNSAEIFTAPIALAFITSYVVGLGAIHWLVWTVQKNQLKNFSFYLLILGALTILSPFVKTI